MNKRKLKAIFCLAFALLFLAETFVPMLHGATHDPMEISENAEEGEEKKEKEKETFNADEFLHDSDRLQLQTNSKLTAEFDHLDFSPNSYSEIDTPPPEIV